MRKQRISTQAWLAAIAVTAVMALIGVLGGLQVHGLMQQRDNTHELQKLAKQLVNRAEYAVDFAIMTAFDVDAIGDQPCSPTGQLELQNIVFARSVVKDIRITDRHGVVLCSAFPQATANSISRPHLPPGTAARNEAFSLHKLELTDKTTLGISWNDGGARVVLVVVDLQAQLFDMFPPSIRDQVRGQLVIDRLGTVADIGVPLPPDQRVDTFQASNRFPLKGEVSLNANAMQTWNSESRSVFALLGGIFGIIAAVFAGREWTRPVSPEAELLSATRSGEIQPYFQATFDLGIRTINGCEILMRWVKPDGRIVSPSQFIPLAEASGAIVPMTRVVLKRALEELAPLIKSDRQFNIAVNITPLDFISDGFERQIIDITKAAGLATRRLTLEITERDSNLNVAALNAAAKRVRGLGFKVALDDVGTGHNGLSHLQDLDIDVLKIDKKFTDFAGTGGPADAIIEMLVGLAKRLGVKTLAEGIETEAQSTALLALGVDRGQGYLVGKPMPAAIFLQSLELAPSHQNIAQRHAA